MEGSTCDEVVSRRSRLGESAGQPQDFEPPPFNPDAQRRLILVRIARYQELYPGSGVTSVELRDSRRPANPVDQAQQFQMAALLLSQDLKELHHATLYLHEQLASERAVTWVVYLSL